MWYTLVMALPISLKNCTSQYEMFLKLCKKLNETICDVKTLIANDSNNRADISNLQKEVSALQNDLEALSKYVASLAAMRDELEHMIDAGLQNITVQVSKQINEQNTNIRLWENEQENKRIDYQNNLTSNLTNLINQQLKQIDDLHDYVDSMSDYLSNDLRNYIDEIFKNYDIYYVINPITGKVDSINNTLAMLWTLTNRAPTCAQYAALGLTCDEYASYDWTCYEYLRLMHDKMHELQLQAAMTMHNPLTGKNQNVKDVVYQIIMSPLYRWDSLSCDSYARLNLTCDEYLSKNLTVEQYNDHSKTLLGGIYYDNN